jgi:hypothetical protein
VRRVRVEQQVGEQRLQPRRGRAGSRLAVDRHPELTEQLDLEAFHQ